MLYYSTNKSSPIVDFRQATIHGQAPDGGLYFPESIPVLPLEFLNNLKSFSNEEIALKVITPYIGDSIPLAAVRKIVNETINFPFPLIKITGSISSLELFHGPTLAFKDVGARFMSRCLAHFVQGLDKKITVLVATSGDTGGAVASGFYDVPGIEVVILYPAGKVSRIQELQLTTYGNNITALKINGSFDECQQMVKQAFRDKELNEKIFLTSANSINVARWLPQQFYYFFALKQWEEITPPVISVPSGNFGNVCAGLMAFRSGLPVSQFIAACNSNNTVPEYLATGKYNAKKAMHTISNAMDVGDPSNFVRILEIFGHDLSELRHGIQSISIDDERTKEIIRQVYAEHQYLLDPHGAVGFLALQNYLLENPGKKGFFLETAHPVKFNDVVEGVIREKIKLPLGVEEILYKRSSSISVNADSGSLRDYLAGV
ncbi:MAG: threonine synthase [Chitinophagaceae bacterium]